MSFGFLNSNFPNHAKNIDDADCQIVDYLLTTQQQLHLIQMVN